VQLRFEAECTSEVYVREEGWKRATLEACPVHSDGTCGLRRLGTYPRVKPPGTRIARFYCPTGRFTISLLPDCFASRWSGDLDAIEEVVVVAEAAPSIEAAADVLRPDITLTSAVRWIRRRLRPVRRFGVLVKGLLPDRVASWPPTMSGLRAALATHSALVTLRGLTADRLHLLPSPAGFGPRSEGSGGRSSAREHEVGAVPPGAVVVAPSSPASAGSTKENTT